MRNTHAEAQGTHVVVVPGNHDVKWGTPPSSKERYGEFISRIRSLGYITPILDGTDTGSSGRSIDPSGHKLTLDGGRVEIVPLNSANYCGTLDALRHLTDEDLQTIPAFLRQPLADTVLKELNSLRLYDVPRFSPQQLEAVSKLLEVAPSKNAGTIRVGVLHHQILPVSSVEEFKPFESIVNLGTLREFLHKYHFNVVLHGHKHTAAAIWDDQTVPSGLENSSRIQRTLIISGSTVGCSASSREDACRLIRLDAETTAAEVRVTSVPALPAGIPIDDLAERRFSLWDLTHIDASHADECKVFLGETLDETYDKLCRHFAGRSEQDTVNYLVCEVKNASHPVSLPSRYPELPSEVDDDRQRWLEGLVRWWQRPQTVLDDRSGFTHGERIYKYDGQLNQLEGALAALEQDRATSRAVISLFNPPVDGWSSRRKVPSFCMFHVLLARRTTGLALDCVAYYRKQEMRYWWPVNVAELVYLQHAAVERLSTKYKDLHSGLYRDHFRDCTC